MRRILMGEEIKSVSFPDAYITEFLLDIVNRRLSCTTNLSHASGKPNVMFGETSVAICGWSHLVIRESCKSQYVEQIYDPEVHKLKDICDNVFSKRVIMLTGFPEGDLGLIDYVFVDAKISIEVMPEDDDD